MHSKALETIKPINLMDHFILITFVIEKIIKYSIQIVKITIDYEKIAALVLNELFAVIWLRINLVFP